jgi:predicted membrane-bound mannosyltransferase
MAKTNYWILLVFTSKAYIVITPIFLLACSIIFGFHTLLNIPVFGDRMQRRAIANSYYTIEFLNCLGFVVLLANLILVFRKKKREEMFKSVFFLGLNALISILLYPMTIFVPTL